VNSRKSLTALLIASTVGIASPLSAHAAPPPSNEKIESNIFVKLAKKAVPSVVNISTLSSGGGSRRGPWGGSPDGDLFRKFFEDFFRGRGGMPNGPWGGEEEEEATAPPRGKKGNPRPRAPKAMSLGTGFILEPGIILTNNHVVAEADEIKIHFTEEADEKPTDGEVIGRDPDLDVALIRVKSKREMIPLPLGDSDAVEVGEYVMAVGNPFGQGHSVTHGIISAKGRYSPDFPLATYIQTDAPINPGNSGGPLINTQGEVIGINNAIHQGAQGIGFAIPVNLVKRILPQLKTKGTVTRGYIGVLVNELTPDIAAKIKAPADLRAPLVTRVYPGEPADKAGLKDYDIITEFNGKPVRTSVDLISGVTSVNVGTAVPMKVLRDGKELNLKIQVSKRPASDQLVQKDTEEKGRDRKKAPARIETGMSFTPLTAELAQELGVKPGSGGVVVSNVDYGSPADTAGIMRGDLILEVDRKPVKDLDAFYELVKEKKSYLLRVRRSDPAGREVFSVMILDLKAN
jgi:serine protease Do